MGRYSWRAAIFSLRASGVNVRQVIYGPDGCPYVLGPLSLNLANSADGTTGNYGTTVDYGSDTNMGYCEDDGKEGPGMVNFGDGTGVNYGTIVGYGDGTNMGDCGDNVTTGPGMVNFGDGTAVHYGTIVDYGDGTSMGDCGDDGTKSAGYGDGTAALGPYHMENGDDGTNGSHHDDETSDDDDAGCAVDAIRWGYNVPQLCNGLILFKQDIFVSCQLLLLLTFNFKFAVFAWFIPACQDSGRLNLTKKKKKKESRESEVNLTLAGTKKRKVTICLSCEIKWSFSGEQSGKTNESHPRSNKC